MKEFLTEHPCPTLKRDCYQILNGLWQFQIVKDGCKTKYNDYIEVPYSPESIYSGVGKTLLPDEELWYSKTVVIPSYLLEQRRIILHFGAVDQICDVYINGKFVTQHIGGYTPFQIDITNYIDNYIANIELRVKDYTEKSELSRGKQSLTPRGIFYPCQSGIWQTVWMESVPLEYIKNVKIIPNVDLSCIDIEVSTTIKRTCMVKMNGQSYLLETNQLNRIPIKNPHLWSCEYPYLYPVSIIFQEDKVETYFGMRKIEVKQKGVIPYIYLNNKPVFLNGVLDQGYYGKGLYTPENTNVFKKDILDIKKLGFNTVRKHIKMESPLFYYYCDVLGILVIQDMINGGGKYLNALIASPLLFNFTLKDHHYSLFRRNNPLARVQFENEIREMIELLQIHPSVVMYTAFNEGWGQYDSKRIFEFIKNLDSSRLIDPASGWFDQGIGDIVSKHCYFKKYHYEPDKLGRATILSEYGGYSFGEKRFFYGHCKDELAYIKKIKDTISTQIAPFVDSGLNGAIFTQLYDVFEEKNGLKEDNGSLKRIPDGWFEMKKW